MTDNMPKTINEAIKILAYNEWAWTIGSVAPHSMDRKTITSLAEAQYPWTERQAKLATFFVKRYLTKFLKYGIDLKSLTDDPKFAHPFRIINSAKTIESELDDDGEKLIMKFPYNKKLVTLIRTLKGKNLPEGYFLYDGENKTWTVTKSDVTAYYVTLIGIRYDFTFIDENLIEEYEEIKKLKIQYKKPDATIKNNKIVLKNVNGQLLDYWNTNFADQKTILQLDSLKNFAIEQGAIEVNSNTQIANKIAHNNNTALWIDKNTYTRDNIVAGLLELNCFPLVMPVSGDITDNIEDTIDMHDWFECFKKHGFDEGKNFGFSFELKEPKKWKDKNSDEKWATKLDQGGLQNKPYKMADSVWQNAYDLYQMSKSFKTIDQHTKVYFVRNKLTRSLMRANIKFKCSLTAIGGGFYHTGGERMKRLLDNLPKKLYYSTSQPLSYQWKDRAIKKL